MGGNRVEECTSVFECHHEWGCRLLMKAALKESDIVEKVTSIMDKYFPSSEETSLDWWERLQQKEVMSLQVKKLEN
jgi:hypothetical protein